MDLREIKNWSTNEANKKQSQIVADLIRQSRLKRQCLAATGSLYYKFSLRAALVRTGYRSVGFNRLWCGGQRQAALNSALLMLSCASGVVVVNIGLQ